MRGIFLIICIAALVAGPAPQAKSTVQTFGATLVAQTRGDVTLLVDLTDGSVVCDTTKVTARAISEAGISEVVFEVDGKKAGRDTSTPYVFDWDTVAYDDGPHTLVVKATDLEGATRSVERKVSIDNQIAKGAEFHIKTAEDLLADETKLTPGKIAEAILAGRKAVKAGPESAPAASVLGRAYYKAKQLDNALMNLDMAVELNPADMATRTILVRANVERAEKVLPSDDSYATYMGEAISHYRVLEAQQLALVQQTVSENGTPKNRYELGRALIAIGKYSDALTEFRKASQAEPDNPVYTNALALALYLNGQPRQAVNALDALAKRGKDNYFSYCIRSLMFESQGGYDKALENVQAAELKGGDAFVVPLLSALLQMRKASTLPCKPADEVIKAVLAAAPESAEAHHFRAAMLSDAGKYYEALEENNKALRINPTLAEAYAELAIIYMRNQWAEQLDPYPCARAVYAVGLSVDPKCAYVLTGMAIAAAEDGDERQALVYAQQAAEAAPDKPYVQVILAYGYTKNRYPQEARDAMEKARTLSQDVFRYASPPALPTLFILYRKYGRSPIIRIPDQLEGESSS